MSDALDFAMDTARQAGGLLCELYHQHHTIHYKSSDIDVVTEADLAADQLLVGAIQERFPEHAILSEEGAGDLGQEVDGIQDLWLVDPLDGTVNYAHGHPMWGVSLALAQHGRVVMGVTYDPLRDEMFWAEQGEGAWCNGRKMQVSGLNRLRNALVATGFPYTRATVADNNLAEFGAIMPRVQGVRRGGSAVLDLAYLADGRLDAYWEKRLSPWDWAAGCLMVQEAGGMMTGMYGEPWTLAVKHAAVSNGRLHDELLALILAARRG